MVLKIEHFVYYYLVNESYYQMCMLHFVLHFFKHSHKTLLLVDNCFGMVLIMTVLQPRWTIGVAVGGERVSSVV